MSILSQKLIQTNTNIFSIQIIWDEKGITIDMNIKNKILFFSRKLL